MNIYKFGGASIATPARMSALASIIQEARRPLVLIVSALGKTTNALEAIVAEACAGRTAEALELAKALENEHRNYAATLVPDHEVLEAALDEHFIELQWAIEDAESSRYDYWYDQMVPLGELLSTRILWAMLQHSGMPAAWLDARDLIKTDFNYRDARVDLLQSERLCRAAILPLAQEGKIVITQGFIGGTPDVTSVTLGREGSDYSAALIAAFLGAEGLTIWKDVPALLAADPKIYPELSLPLPYIPYREVVELSFYGAQVIHPKTIKPLENSDIPLFVRSFLEPGSQGTVISRKGADQYPPLVVLKENQVLIQATSRDFSFISEEGISQIYQAFHAARMRINLMQTAAISFLACVDANQDKLSNVIHLLESAFAITHNTGAALLTIRHEAPGVLASLTAGRKILLEQRTLQTVQVVLQ